ncbi:MAG: PAS domain-containing protein [Cyanobacteriota bacterium]|nr:PAS domain-containing protein [Cyanobacteriota bacterium]
MDNAPIDIIDIHPVRVAPTTSINGTIAQMHQQQRDFAFVVDGERLVGTFVATNLVEAIATHLDLETVTVDRVMNADPVVLEVPDSQFDRLWGLTRAAIDLASEHHLHVLPVVDTRGCPMGAICVDRLLGIADGTDRSHSSPTPTGETVSELRRLVRELERRIGQRTAQLQESHDLLIEEVRDRLLAQIAASKLEDEFRVAIDNIPNAFAIYDRHRRYQFVNSEGLRCRGKSADELVGFRDEEIFSSEIVCGYLPLLERAVATRTPQTQECQLYDARTDREIDAVVTYVPLLDEAGEIDQILGIANDITERKRSEEERQAATDRLRAVLDAVPGFVSWIVRHPKPNDSQPGAAVPSLFYEGVNRQLAASWNRSPEEFVGQRVGFMEDKSQFTEFMVEFMAGPDRSASRTIDVNVGGSQYSYLIAAQKYQQDTAAVSVGIDITEQKQAEASLRYQLAFEQLVMSISTDFLNLRSEEIDGGIERALQQIGEFAGVDASYIFQFSEDGTQASMTHEWVSLGIEPQRPYQQNIPLSMDSTAIAQLKRGEVLYLQNSEASPVAREYLEWPGRAKSVAAVPAIYQGRAIGFIGFDTIHTTKLWSESSVWLLRTIGEILTNTLQRQQAERELRQSERKFRAIFDRAFQFVALLHPDGRVVEINQTALDFAALKSEDVVGRLFCQIPWWSSNSDWPRKLREDIASAAAGCFVRDEVEARGIQGKTVTLDFSLKPVRDEAGKVVLVIAEGRDMTERKLAAQERQRAYQRSQLLSEVTLKIRQSLKLEEILQTAVEELQKLLEVSRVSIFALESGTAGRVVKEAVLPGWPTLAGREIDDPRFYTDDPDGVPLGYQIADVDVAEEENGLDLSLLRGYGVKAALVVPIWVSGAGTQRPREEPAPLLWGFSIVHQCDRPREWTTSEIGLLQQLADQMGIAISNAQLIDNLEEIVAQRTAELRSVNQNLEREIRDRRRAEIALRRSEQQLRLTADALPVAIAYVDAGQIYRFNNRTYEDWLGKPLSQITDCHLHDVLGDRIYQSCRDYIETALSGSRVTYETQQPEINGISRYLSVTYIPDISETGEVKGYFGVEVDISDRHAVEQMKDEFLSVASHELRTPLTSIRGSLGLLATGQLGRLAPKGGRMLEIALKNTDRLCRLINDILDLERMESGQTQILMQTCNGVELMFQAAEAMQAMAASANVSLQVIWNDRPFEIGLGEQSAIDFEQNIKQNTITIWADADRILQTLINLISNAIKFSPPHETVSISAIRQDREVCFQVSDRGRGIPAEQLESIFGRFQQVDASDSRQKGGTGLGLAICRQIVRQHGGRIWVESTLGVGSRFYVSLPLFSDRTVSDLGEV